MNVLWGLGFFLLFFSQTNQSLTLFGRRARHLIKTALGPVNYLN